MDEEEDSVFDDYAGLVTNDAGLYSQQEDEENDVVINKKRKQTINVMYFTMFIGSISFSIVMSSLWPFLRKMDDHVTETFLGWVNSGFSLAQLVCSVIFGYWCDKRPSIEPLLLSIVLLAVGSGLYAYAEAFGTVGIWIVLGARILLGCSAGNISVARAVSAHLSKPEELTKVMSFLSLYQALGFFVGPALQAAAKPAGSKGIYIPSAKFYFNIYTAPCYFMILLSMLNVGLVVKYFVEDIGHTKDQFKEEEKRKRGESKSYEPVDKVAIGVTLLLFFVTMSVFALNETIISPLLMNMFAWSRDLTVFYGGIILAVSGLLGIACFGVIAPLTNRFSEKTVLAGGLIILLLGFFLYLMWGPGYLKLTMIDLNFPNGTVVNPVDDGKGGCPWQYEWCHDTPQLPLAQFLVGATLVCIGFPVSCVLISILYSKIIGPFPQGAYMGWLSAVGSFARVVGPLYVTFVYVHLGARVMVICTCSLIAFIIFVLFVSWKRVKPYNEAYRRLSSLSVSVNI